jgi:putative ABC transport system permease protein
MWTLARKILLHDRIKFVVAAAGVSVSVLLVLVQVGLYFGFMENASTLIDHARADVWLAGEGNENFDFAGAIDEQAIYRVAGTPGVARVEPMLLAFGQFKLPSGGTQAVQVVGLARGGRLAGPWNVVAGDAERTAEADGMVVDRTEFAKLQIHEVGARTEVSGVRARVVALTSGIRSFTTSPFVFTNLDTARAFTRLGDRQITHILVQAAPGTDLVALRARLAALPHLEAFTAPEMSARARTYWSSRTGVGAGFFTTAAMGVIVGLVIVGQILYNGTLEHLREYGTLKAMGVRNGAVVGVILWQAFLSALVGIAAGSALAFGARAAMRSANLIVALPPGLLATTGLLTVAMCSLASLLSIHKVLRLDPATVFKG